MRARMQFLGCILLGVGVSACFQRTDVEMSACWPTCDASPTDQCQNLSCIHGTCRVDAGSEAWCECEAGYHPVSRTVCAASEEPLKQCDSRTCPSGHLCRQETGRCDAPVPSECGLGASDGGTAKLYSACTRGVSGGPWPTCAAGLTCAPRIAYLDLDAGAYVFLEGVCLASCDPCGPTCPDGTSCILISGKGGYCNPGPLKTLGEQCGIDDICNAGLTCSERDCRKPCRPNDRFAWATQTFQTEFHSDDCPSGERCSLSRTALRLGSSFTCKPGTRVGTGEPCSTRCGEPNMCIEGYSLCSVDCSKSPCPDGVECFVFTQDVRQPSLCVRDGVINAGRPCAAERNCRPGLLCSHGWCTAP